MHIHIAVNGDVADAEHCEALFDVETGVQQVFPETREGLGDDSNLTALNIGDYLLESGTKEVRPGASIIYIKAGVVKSAL